MWVKICGLTSETSLEAVIPHSPDAVGLNFYAKSKRNVEVQTAHRLVRMLPSSILPVGLFVNHTLDQINSICDATGIRTIQLHGDETPEFASQLKKYQLIRAFRVGEEGLDAVAQELAEYDRLGTALFGCLIDAKVDNAYGGTGHVAPWEILVHDWQPAWPPLILAGGLTPLNVSAAVQQVSPFGVDVASGVEATPGLQDSQQVLQFITAARRAVAVSSPS